MARIYSIQEWDMHRLSIEGLRKVRQDAAEISKRG